MRNQYLAATGLLLMAPMIAASSRPAAPVGQDQQPPTATVQPQHTPSMLKVTNNNGLDMDIYAVRTGQHVHLGMVTAFTTATLQLPEQIASPGDEVRFLADALGSRAAYYSDPITITRGDQVQLTIEPDLNISNLAILPR